MLVPLLVRIRYVMTSAAVLHAWLLVVPVVLLLLATSLPISLDPRQPQWMECQQGQAFADINTGKHREPDSAASPARLLHQYDQYVGKETFNPSCRHHCPGCTV